MADASVSFPRQNARTVGFSLGVPYAFAIASDGNRVAFLRARSGTDRTTGLWVRAGPEAENVTYGLAEFVAAEEMDRTRGFWWSPDGRQLLVARVDTTPVARWHLGDPAHPDRPPVELAYPRAGTANAEVSVVL